MHPCFSPARWNRSERLCLAWVAAILALVTGLPAVGATKYVATNGDDAHDGNTRATAYRTIAKGLREIGPGGCLYVGGGTYDEAILNSIPSGLSGRDPTVLRNAADETVTLRPPAGLPRVIEFNGHARNIAVFASAPGKVILDASRVGHNAVKFSSAGPHGAGAWPEHIRLENLEIKGSHDSAVLGYCRACAFIRLHIHDAGSSVYDHGMYIEGCDNLIDGCDIHDNYARGIQIFMSGKHGDTRFASRNTVRNCRIHHNGRVRATPKPGIDADSGTGNRIYNNLIYANGQFGLMIQIGGTANEVYNNTFFGNGSAAVFIKASAGAGTIVRNNLAWQNGTDAAYVDQRKDGLASHNAWGTEDPHFASLQPGAANFLRLTAASRVAIDRGTAQPPIAALVMRDIWGVPRPQGQAIDLGAAELPRP